MTILMYVLTLIASSAGTYCAMVLWANLRDWRLFKFYILMAMLGLLAAIGTLIYTGYQVAW